MAAKPTGTQNPKQSGGRLTENTDPALDRTVRDKLVTARIGLLLRAPFFGNLATRLELINADSWLPTAATDGRKFYYNTEFCNKLKPKELEFLFGHEVLHNVYDHMGRNGERDRRLFNCAADFCVNSDLIRRLTPAGKSPAPVACAACSSASRISSLIASRSSLLSRGRPLPLPSTSSPSSPSSVSLPSKCSSSI